MSSELGVRRNVAATFRLRYYRKLKLAATFHRLEMEEMNEKD